METKKILSALAYFSIMFAGILFPAILYFASDEIEVKQHAKRALLSQLIPLIPIPFVLYSAYHLIVTSQTDFPVLVLAGIGISILLSMIVLIWNLVQGIRVLKN